MDRTVRADPVPEDFRLIEQEWRPGVAVTEDVITAGPPAGFAAVLDQPNPVVKAGDELPPLWHWLYFLAAPAQSSLGGDGHPREGAFLPPLAERRRMFGGARLEVHGPLRCGERVQRRTSIPSIRTRIGNSGPLLITTLRHEFHVDGELRVVEDQQLVYRRAADVRQPRDVAPEPQTRPEGELTLAFDTDPVVLFRFSALTWNNHRIHYDHEYTREVEGYPDLIVHGPLVALLLLELPRRARQPVGTFTWRALAPVFVNDTVEVFGRREGGELQLTAGAAGAWRSVVGTVTP